MNERFPLESEIRRRISVAGPMPVVEYMALCLFDREHGYYTTHDPFGARGDFRTQSANENVERAVADLRATAPARFHQRFPGYDAA